MKHKRLVSALSKIGIKPTCEDHGAIMNKFIARGPQYYAVWFCWKEAVYISSLDKVLGLGIWLNGTGVSPEASDGGGIYPSTIKKVIHYVSLKPSSSPAQ